MATASDTGNPPRPLARQLRVGDKIPVFSLPNTSGVSVSSTVLLEAGPLIITFYRGIWCPYCRSDLMALMNATFEVTSSPGTARSPMSTSTPTIGWHPNWLGQWQRYVAFRRKSARKQEFRYQWIRLRRQQPVKPR